jgi:hypothetical protein
MVFVRLKKRVISVQASYANEFTFLYRNLGEAVAFFVAFEQGLSKITPILEYAPFSAPTGLGRNAHFRTAPCVDITPYFINDDKLFVGVMTTKKFPRCLEEYGVAADGSISIAVKSEEVTALEEFMEETGADEIGKLMDWDRIMLPFWIGFHLVGRKIFAPLDALLKAQLKQV